MNNEPQIPEKPKNKLRLRFEKLLRTSQIIIFFDSRALFWLVILPNYIYKRYNFFILLRQQYKKMHYFIISEIS